MNKVLKLLKQGIKYSFYCTTAFTISGYAYLQYITSVLGPINIDKQTALNFYKDHHRMDEAQAKRTYYWVLAHISLSRIMSFRSYKKSCDSLNSKIVQPMLATYQKQGILDDIAAANEKSGKTKRTAFNKIVDIRRINTENIQVRQYIIKQIKTLQKEMHSNLLLGIPKESISKIDSIHQFICETGRTFRDPQILRYISKLPEIEDKYPGDYLHKILFI